MPRVQVVAANGLLHRRLFLQESAGIAGLALLRATPAAAAQSQDVPAWMKAPGQGCGRMASDRPTNQPCSVSSCP